jgi:hypothetical protein
LTKYDPVTLCHVHTVFDFNVKDGTEAGGHYGGDKGLISDFVDLLNDKKPSVSCMSIEGSVNGHLCVFAADIAMKRGRRMAVK